MKTIIASIFLLFSIPLNASENIGDRSKREAYQSQEGYALENTCFRYEYREYYVPGNANSPGYVHSYKERVSIPCSNTVSNHYYLETERTTSNANYEFEQKCTGSTVLGGLIGGAIAASLSTNDAYGWTIPLGAVIGGGVGNAQCN
mgnify:FL=1